MHDKSSIKFKIPVPWAPASACIEANGRLSVIVAGIVVVIVILIFVIR
jgi:uncharacterized integral membrane protein